MNHIQHAFSCARFDVRISSHGTSKTAANCLLHLGAMLQQHSDEMHVMETKEEGEDSPSHSHQTSTIFNELNEKKTEMDSIAVVVSYFMFVCQNRKRCSNKSN